MTINFIFTLANIDTNKTKQNLQKFLLQTNFICSIVSLFQQYQLCVDVQYIQYPKKCTFFPKHHSQYFIQLTLNFLFVVALRRINWHTFCSNIQIFHTYIVVCKCLSPRVLVSWIISFYCCGIKPSLVNPRRLWCQSVHFLLALWWHLRFTINFHFINSKETSPSECRDQSVHNIKNSL